MNRFQNLPRRIKLTVQYEGVGGFVLKSVRFLLRLTPFGRYVKGGDPMHDRRRGARRWYRRDWRPVTIVIPSYGDPEPAIRAVRSVRKTTRAGRVRVLVVDDGSPPEAQRRLQQDCRAEVQLHRENVGFARNVNRALRSLRESGDGDVVLLNSDVIAHSGWLESLQYTALSYDEVGIVGAKLLYPDRTIQHAGMCRNADQPEWFDHRFRFRPAAHGPANLPGPALGVTGACMYLTRETLDAVGVFDDGYGMAYEDIDLCLRAWEHGIRTFYEPAAELTHFESKSRGMVQGERELASQAHFWRKWAPWFDRRNVRTASGKLRVVYVTEDTGVGGGHRDIFEHLNRLAERGHEVSLYSLGDPPDWFDLGVPVRTFEDYEELTDALAEVDAIKVATWWATAEPVWLASLLRGIPVYFVQDIETSYYPDDERARDAVLSSYRPEFRYMTISSWNRERLAELSVKAELVPPGIDLGTYRPLEVERRGDVVLALGRSHPLKNLPLTVEAWKGLPEPRPELWLFGIEPELGERYGARYFTAPSDDEVNELLNRATVLVQTSRHEGFCLPILEAMAAGASVVSTDADGNRDVCRDGSNCLMPEATPESVRAALARVLSDAAFREQLAREGKKTAAGYSWELRIDELERFLEGVAPAPSEALSEIAQA